jgi:hypothetical protein
VGAGGAEARVWVYNLGRRPIEATIFLLNAEDGTPVGGGKTAVVSPQGGAFEDITVSLGIKGVTAVVRVEGRSPVRMSLEVAQTGGQLIFTDGFESGDVS